MRYRSGLRTGKHDAKSRYKSQLMSVQEMSKEDSASQVSRIDSALEERNDSQIEEQFVKEHAQELSSLRYYGPRK